MKQLKISSLLIIMVCLSACQSTKTTTDALYNTSWELDYISGIRIAFSGLYPDRKPQISFNKTTNNVEGSASCNGYRAEYNLDGNNISFGDPGPTTMMYCGEGEQTFLSTMKKINKYGFDEEGKLILMLDDVTMMRFKKVNEN
ncbi:META domain-containing protein [Confluentibacter citreus]|uniref:META domain-containing protein n=1 Tax=Confluentibacter citreus TaxID=2007307 RepID=UPI001EFC3E74|nr:META domain-containing protein [Confluentibacter citreus]